MARNGLAIYKPPMRMTIPVIAMFWHRRADATIPQAWLRRRIAALLERLNIREAMI